MSADDEAKRVHFNGPRDLIERADALASLFEKDRTDIIVEALREYISDRTSDETFRQMVASAYYRDQLDHETVADLVDPETAHRFRLLKDDLEEERLDVPAPDRDVDVYDGETETVDR